MLKYLLLVVVAATAFKADAQVFKCKGADGKTQFSDTPCKGAAQAEIVKDRGSYVAPQDQYNAQQRTARMQGDNKGSRLDCSDRRRQGRQAPSAAGEALGCRARFTALPRNVGDLGLTDPHRDTLMSQAEDAAANAMGPSWLETKQSPA
jgi:hypothetical protein